MSKTEYDLKAIMFSAYDTQTKWYVWRHQVANSLLCIGCQIICSQHDELSRSLPIMGVASSLYLKVWNARELYSDNIKRTV